MDDGVNVEIIRDNDAFLSFGLSRLFGLNVCAIVVCVNRFASRQFGSLVIAKLG